MLQCTICAGMRDVAVFDLFVRRLPRGRNFLVAAGLEQVLDISSRCVSRPRNCVVGRAVGIYAADFVERLAKWRFTGDVNAMPEGTIFFAGEPILRITAPIEQRSWSSRGYQLVQFQTMIASKAVLGAGSAGKTACRFWLSPFRHEPKPVCWRPERLT